MAGADGIRNLELEPLEVPDKLIRGNKFVKWPKSDGDDTIVATPVTLKIDPKGYIIYWQEPNKDTESLEVSSIRDTRIEKYAKIPKCEKWEKALQSADPQIREVAGNTSIPLESKCLTIVYGMKFHEPNFLNFIAVEENPLDIIKLWADFLLELAYHPLTWHISVEKSIEKMHTKLRYETNQFGQIPVKKCIKMFGGNPKRAESAFQNVGLTTKGKKDEMINPEEFPLIAFKKVLQFTCQRPELDKVFAQLGARRIALSLEQMKRFINTDQRDPRLNEILHPFLTDEQVEAIIMKYEPNIMFSKKSMLSLEGLEAYLQSDENLPVSSARYGLHQDLSHPLSHYFINSSHNTYLTGNQYRSRSSAEIYRQCLLAGCRCVELDCWEPNSAGVEPVITHGFTFCSEISFKEVIEAINESAFKTSQYPVILSFENHVDNPQQQGKMAQYCRDIFGDKLLIDPLETHALTPGTPLPSPKDLLGKIIVKNKKQKPPTRSEYSTKKLPGEEKGRYTAYKRGSIPSEGSAFSPSSASPAASPSFFPSGKPVPRNTSTSSGKSIPSVGRKRSEPVVGMSHTTPLVMSPSLPMPHSENGITQNGPLNQSNGNLSNRNGVMGSNGTPKARKLKGKLRTAQSLEEETLPELRMFERSEFEDLPSASNSLTRTPRKISAPTPTVEEKNRSVECEECKDECEEESQLQDLEEEPTGDDGESKDKIEEEDDDDDEDEGQISLQEFDENMKESGTATRESRAYEAMSSLVNYIQPVRFKSFEISDKRNRSYEISSFTENAALRLISYYPVEIVNYNKRQLSRIYPKGARMDSSNYNPQLFWNAGCQLVALNFQTLDPNMQLNLGLFEFNNNCGYLLKPEHMRRKDRQFDPFAQNTLDGVVAGSISIRIISGQFVSSSKVNTYVEVDMYGLVADTVKKKHRTSTVYGNGTNPHYDSENFVFDKVVLPELAILRIGVMDTNGNCLGQRFLPVDGLRPGYRYITLRNEGNQPLTMPSLFVRIEVKDYIPEKLEPFVSILANPIEHIRSQEQKEREIRGRHNALKRLLNDDEKKMLTSENPQLNWDVFGENGNARKVVIKVGMPENNVHSTENSAPGSDGVTVYLPTETGEEHPQTEKPKKSGLEELQTFKPDGLDVIKTGKEYNTLQRKMDEKIAKLVKKRREEYDTIFDIYSEKIRRPSFATLFTRSPADRTRRMNLPFEINTALPNEAKREHLLMLLRQHVEEEKKDRQNLNDDFMKNFDELVRVKQTAELKELEKLSKSEKAEVTKRKNAEKDEKTRNLPSDLSKDEFERRKKDIIEVHVQESVYELKMLVSKQERRLEKVKGEQQEILMKLNEEERKRIDAIQRNYNQQLDDVEKIYDIRQVDFHRKKGHNTLNINSVTYPTRTSDGTNDDGSAKRFTLEVPGNQRRTSVGQLNLDTAISSDQT